MTPESRAKEIVRSLCEPLDGGKPYLETPIRKTMAGVIAQAIRQAENDKLEEAARAADFLSIVHPIAGGIAMNIRSLKSKD